MFLISDRSGGRASQGNIRIPYVTRKVRTRRATFATSSGLKLLEMHWSAFKLLSIRSRDVRVMYQIAAQNITPGARPLCLHRMQAGDVWSPLSLQTCIRPSEYGTQNRDSFEKSALCHFSNKLWGSGNQSRRLSLCYIVKGSRSNGHRADRAHCHIVERNLCALQTCPFPHGWFVMRLYGFADLT